MFDEIVTAGYETKLNNALALIQYIAEMPLEKANRLYALYEKIFEALYNPKESTDRILETYGIDNVYYLLNEKFFKTFIDYYSNKGRDNVQTLDKSDTPTLNKITSEFSAAKQSNNQSGRISRYLNKEIHERFRAIYSIDNTKVDESITPELIDSIIRERWGTKVAKINTDDSFDTDFTDENPDFPDIEGTDKDDDNPGDGVDNSVDIQSNEDNDTEEDEDESVYNIPNSLVSKVNQAVNIIVKVLIRLYGSGFSALPQVGLLINNGNNSPIIKLNSSNSSDKDYRLIDDIGIAYDHDIMNTIVSQIPDLTNNAPFEDAYGKLNVVPDIDLLVKGNVSCTALHLMFQNANIRLCTGDISIRRWITEERVKDNSEYKNVNDWIEKANNNNKTKLIKIDDIKDWYAWSIKRIISRSLNYYDIHGLQDKERANEIIDNITRTLRNVIVISERDIGLKIDDNTGKILNADSATPVKEEIRISTSTSSGINAEDVIKSLESKLNISGSNAIQIKQLAEDALVNDSVLFLQIIYDSEEANKANTFAYEVISKMVESGIVPSWDNALLGKKEDGSYLMYTHFTDRATPAGRTYAIYGASGSGKGVMTSTLIASALCDGRHVFYTDGKPENGAALGRIAWKKGKEAYVFDGKNKGDKPFSGYLEEYTFGVRTSTEVMDYLDKCPENLFQNGKHINTEDQRKFLGVTRYLKSLYLFAEICLARSEGRLDSSDWQVWIFDEMQNMAKQELDVREVLCKYVRSVADLGEAKGTERYKVNFKQIKDEKILQDPGVIYVKEWLSWASAILNMLTTAATISLRKANLNAIFIFQTAEWLKDPNYCMTSICKAVKSLDCTKIMGRGSLIKDCGEWGDGNTINGKWYAEKVNSKELGWWAISDSSSARGSVTVYKPLNVWTVPINNDAIDEDAENNGGGGLKYLGPYVEYLLSFVGKDPADLLQEAYDYADNAVKKLELGESIKQYIYDCSAITAKTVDASIEKLRNDYIRAELNKENISDERKEYLLGLLNNNEEEDGAPQKTSSSLNLTNEPTVKHIKYEDNSRQEDQAVLIFFMSELYKACRKYNIQKSKFETLATIAVKNIMNDPNKYSEALSEYEASKGFGQARNGFIKRR